MPAFTEGQLIDGKYEVLERLAEGGMSEVYKVRHLHLDELRIVKIMPSDLAREESTSERFQHEAKLASRVRHRNIASLHDFSRLEDGSFYMVSEYLDGYTVQSWIHEKGRIEPLVAIEIAIQVLTGLEAIHKAGVVHRDVSPDNIMIVADDEADDPPGFIARILDLGIAKSLDEDEGGRTQTGAFVGKARYASPEQAGLLGKGETIDQRSDIYSLGVTLYEMLSGTAPFDSPTPEGYLLKHIHETPAPLTAAMGGAAIPAGLAQIVEKAMAKDRNGRFDSAAEFKGALSALRDQKPAEHAGPLVTAAAAPSGPVNSSMSKGRERSRLVVPLIIAAIALLALSAVWAGWRAADGGQKTDTVRITPDPVFPPFAATPPPTESAVVEGDAGSYAIVEELSDRAPEENVERENGESELGTPNESEREAERDPDPAGEASPATPDSRIPPRAAATPASTPRPTPAPTVVPRTPPASRSPRQDRQRLSEAEAVDRLLGFVSSTYYYPVRRECITTRSLGYENEGYKVEVHGGGCPGDERQRRLGVWRVDIWTGEFFVQNANGKFVEP
ncbi:MAG TPA: protein kinase [Thermoanaerobaculia bacterium]|nr:protein kinase [Thermoanaerobaculia bacterium]